jgi:hypothetical protein
LKIRGDRFEFIETPGRARHTVMPSPQTRRFDHSSRRHQVEKMQEQQATEVAGGEINPACAAAVVGAITVAGAMTGPGVAAATVGTLSADLYCASSLADSSATGTASMDTVGAGINTQQLDYMGGA